MKALHIAATGMKAQELNVEVISNNVANMRTTGYKRQRADFQDLLYQNLRRMGAETSDAGTIVPTGVQVGSGVKTAATARIMSQGSLEETGKELDVAIRGEGFFQIQLPDGTTAYTRDGSFERDADGTLVTVDGYSVLPEITIPDDSRDITISRGRQSPGRRRYRRHGQPRVRSNLPASSTSRALKPSATTCSSKLKPAGSLRPTRPATTGSATCSRISWKWRMWMR
jgi:flagellar basal-body rod protein FlgG